MTFGRLDCWKKQKFTHEIATKNTKSHTPDYRQTQNCTPENKKSHTKLPKSDTKITAKDTKSHSTRLQKKTQSRHRGRELGAQSQAETQSLWGRVFLMFVNILPKFVCLFCCRSCLHVFILLRFHLLE
jgi:hypothetical protein